MNRTFFRLTTVLRSILPSWDWSGVDSARHNKNAKKKMGYKLKLLAIPLICITTYVIADPELTFCVYKPTKTIEKEAYTFSYMNVYCINTTAKNNVVVTIEAGSKSGFYCQYAGPFQIITWLQDLCATNSSGMDANVVSSQSSGAYSRLTWDKGVVFSNGWFRTERRTPKLFACEITPGKCHDGDDDYGFIVNDDYNFYVVYYPDSE